MGAVRGWPGFKRKAVCLLALEECVPRPDQLKCVWLVVVASEFCEFGYLGEGESPAFHEFNVESWNRRRSGGQDSGTCRKFLDSTAYRQKKQQNEQIKNGKAEKGELKWRR